MQRQSINSKYSHDANETQFCGDPADVSRVRGLHGRFGPHLCPVGPGYAAAAPPSRDEVLHLSKFEVQTAQDKGYIANNSATGFKTHQELIKIPQSVTVITRDLIDDIGATKTSDVLQYAGASRFYRGESIRLRGARTLNAYMDDAIENVPYSDDVTSDSYEVIRGPAGAPALSVRLERFHSHCRFDFTATATAHRRRVFPADARPD